MVPGYDRAMLHMSLIMTNIHQANTPDPASPGPCKYFLLILGSHCECWLTLVTNYSSDKNSPASRQQITTLQPKYIKTA